MDIGGGEGGIVRGYAANPPLRSGPTRARRPKSLRDFENSGRSMTINNLLILRRTPLPCNPLQSLYLPSDLPPRASYDNRALLFRHHHTSEPTRGAKCATLGCPLLRRTARTSSSMLTPLLDRLMQHQHLLRLQARLDGGDVRIGQAHLGGAEVFKHPHLDHSCDFQFHARRLNPR